jgi:hypothetical protein
MADSFDTVRPFTKANDARFESMLKLLQSLDGVEGDIVECGVWRGGLMMLARMVCPDRVCWLYDTFDGMTVPHPEYDVKRPIKGKQKRAIDRYNQKKAGGTKWDAVSIDEVRDNFRSFGLLDTEHVRMIEGPVEHTLIFGPKPKRIALLRLDTDWYESTKVELEELYPLLVHGGYLIVDDYGHWMGSKKAVNEYFGECFGFVQIDYSCIVMRRP